MKLRKFRTKVETEIFANQFGNAVLVIACPNCNFPVGILKPLKEIFDDLKTGKIFVRANCNHCESGSLNELTEDGLEKIQTFVEGL